MANDNSTIPFQASTLETIDEGFFNWVDKDLDLFCDTNTGWKKSPVFWVGAERSFQSKDDKERFDDTGALIFPAITIERKSINKNPNSKGSAWANVPPVGDLKGGSISITRRLKQDKTANYTNTLSKRKTGQENFPKITNKMVYETITIPMPVYIDINYEVTLRTEYQQQMNTLMSPFITKPGGINYITFENENHRYEAFIQEDFAQSNNVDSMGNEERKYITKITIKVLGYIYSEDKNEEQPKIVRRESIVEVKIPRERALTQEEQDYITLNS